MKFFTASVLFISILTVSAYGSIAHDSGSDIQFFSQQDEVRGTLTLVTGEQLHGYFVGLDDDSRYQQLQFRAEGEDEFTVYRADRVTRAETETGDYFLSFSSELSRGTISTLIGERIYETDIDLFKSREADGSKHFFIINRQGQALYLPEYRYRAALRSAFGDCGDVVRDYSDMGAFYGKNYMMRLFLEYDRCAGYEDDEVVQRYGTEVYRSRLGGGVGLFMSKLSYEYQSQTRLFDEVSFGYESSIDFSIFWDLRLGRRPFFVRPQFVYRSSESSISAITGTNTEEQASYKLNVYSLMVPLRYEFMYGPARPYAAAGALISAYDLSENDYTIRVTGPSGDIQETRRELFELDKPLGFGFHGGVGVRFPELFGRADVYTEVRYTYHHIEDKVRGRIFDVALQGFDFSVAVGF